eukprot:649962_1
MKNNSSVQGQKSTTIQHAALRLLIEFELKMIWIYFLLLLFIINIVYGGLPVSYPGEGIQHPISEIVPYNLIDTNPSCYDRGFCPMFYPGGRLSSFPNSEEKFQMLLHNLWRMWGNVTRNLPLGKYKWGANTQAGLTYYCKTDSCRSCGDTIHPGYNKNGDWKRGTMPLYWYSDANQAARFKQYDENTCDQAWYEYTGSAHSTCGRVLPEYGGGSRCDWFGGKCDMGSRSNAFSVEDGSWFETEGICGGSTCVTDEHCEPIFGTEYDYQGAGFVEGMNGAACTYVRSAKLIFYLLPMAAHFDQRKRVAPQDLNDNRKWFVLMLEYYDGNQTQTPLGCWSIYHKGYHEMSVTVSNVGHLGTGFSRDSYSVMFESIHPPQSKCRPYAFICKTSLGKFVRLPEDGNYYFGTEFMDWSFTNYAELQSRSTWMAYTCKENHYYFDGNQWIANGGPGLDKCDIWHYNHTEELRSGNHTHRETCNGCSDMDRLDCWSQCVYSDFAEEDCDCTGVALGPKYGNEWCDPAAPPTDEPTTSPIPAPTQSPSAGLLSETPSEWPSIMPTVSPSPRPTELPSETPSELPSAGPTEFIGVCCDCLVDTAPILSPSPTAGCASDSECEAQVCGGDPDCCGVGWNAQCVSLAEDICFGTVDPTQWPTKAPVEQQPGNRTPRPTRRRRGRPVFH